MHLLKCLVSIPRVECCHTCSNPHGVQLVGGNDIPMRGTAVRITGQLSVMHPRWSNGDKDSVAVVGVVGTPNSNYRQQFATKCVFGLLDKELRGRRPTTQNWYSGN